MNLLMECVLNLRRKSSNEKGTFRPLSRIQRSSLFRALFRVRIAYSRVDGQILVNNRKFGQKSKIWSKIKNFNSGKLLIYNFGNFKFDLKDNLVIKKLEYLQIYKYLCVKMISKWWFRKII